MTLTVENGCFSYDGRHTVLSDISFCASPGEIVAILGKTARAKQRFSSAAWACSNGAVDIVSLTAEMFCI